MRVPTFVPFASTLNAFWVGDDEEAVEEANVEVPRPLGVRVEPTHARGATVQIGFGGCGGFYNYHLGIASVVAGATYLRLPTPWIDALSSRSILI